MIMPMDRMTLMVERRQERTMSMSLATVLGAQFVLDRPEKVCVCVEYN